MQKILIVNGPNLNIMGQRKNASYAGLGLDDIERMVGVRAKDLGVTVDFRQSNHEGVIVDWLHEALNGVDGVIINPTALTHSSFAIADALGALDCPVIELHFSNVHRDPTKADRHKSIIRRAVTGVIAGFGPRGYIAALDLIHDMQNQKSS
ncbi:MAG: type II 3-dehydroquinate dehydratase [Pseudorhodobacter sp.]